MTKFFLVCRRELGSMCGGPLAWVLEHQFGTRRALLDQLAVAF